MLHRSPAETYNPQIHTEALSLTSVADKNMEVHNRTLDRFSKYNKITSFLYHSGRVNQGYVNGRIKKDTNNVHDNAYRVKRKGALIKQAVSMGSAVFGDFHPTDDMTSVVGVTYTNGLSASTMETDTKGSIAIKHDPDNGISGNKFNPNDTIALDQGLGGNLIILNTRFASTGDHVILNVKYIGSPEEFAEEYLEEDEVFMEAGPKFGEGSLRGYQRDRSEYWDIFYSFISRYTLTFTGSALDQKKVVWCSPSAADARKGAGGNAYWQYEQEWIAEQWVAMFTELGLRYSVSSMDSSTHQWFSNFGKNKLTMAGFNPESGITAPMVPDGWVTQIKKTINLTYDVNTGFDVYFLESLFALLASNSVGGSTGQEYLIVGDPIAHLHWEKCMRKMMGVFGSSDGFENVRHVYNATSGKTVDVGFNVGSYIYRGNRYSFVQDELMSNPGLNASNGGVVGKGNFYVLNITVDEENVSNFEVFSRGRGRVFKKKYINGMHSLDSGMDSGMVASSGFDGARVDWLTDLFPICYNPETCAVVRGTGKYDGGALAGNPDLGKFPHYK